MIETLFLSFLLTAVTAISDLTPIDLSHELNEYTLYYPTSSPFKFERMYNVTTREGVWYTANTFSCGEHTGTHLDAPYHFNPVGSTVEKIPLSILFGKGVFINVSVETGHNADYSLPPTKLDEWETLNGPMPKNSIVIVSFGWSERWPNKTAYFGPSDDNHHYPGLSKEAGEWLARKEEVVGAGIDTPSIDVAVNRFFDVHILLAAEEKFIIENMALYTTLPPLFDVVVLPMKIASGTGAPARVVAFI